MNRGNHDGAPRYRNPNNIYMFRHALSRSEDLGITRQACLPENEVAGEGTESSISAAALSLGREINGKAGMNFSRLVKTSLQGINLDRKAREGHLCCLIWHAVWYYCQGSPSLTKRDGDSIPPRDSCSTERRSIAGCCIVFLAFRV